MMWMPMGLRPFTMRLARALGRACDTAVEWDRVMRLPAEWHGRHAPCATAARSIQPRDPNTWDRRELPFAPRPVRRRPRLQQLIRPPNIALMRLGFPKYARHTPLSRTVDSSFIGPQTLC